MSDALVDFFAKKDKKKKTVKNSSDVSKNLVSNKLSQQTQKKNNFKYLNESSDEWHDFEENREKDYSGLKIQNLSTIEKEQAFLEQRMNETLNENQKDNAWTSKNLTTEQKPVTQVTPVDPVEPVNPPVVMKYIPPSQRTTLSEVPKKKVKKAPEISNKSEFPTLGG